MTGRAVRTSRESRPVLVDKAATSPASRPAEEGAKAAPASRRLSGRNRSVRRLSLSWLVVIFFFIFTVAPYAWLVLTSLKREQDAVHIPIQWLPRPATVANYVDMFSNAAASLGIPTSPALWNTVVISLSSTLLALVLGLPA